MANFCSDLVKHRRVFLIAIVVGMGGTFLFGFQITVIPFASPFIKNFINDTWLERYNAPIDDQTLTVLWSVIVSALSVGGLIGAGLSRYLSSRYGKRNSLVLSNLLVVVAALITGTSKLAHTFEMILLGRFLYGFGAGLGSCIQIQYLGEISPKKIRGLINVTAIVLANLGRLLGQVTGLRELLGTEALWPLLLASTGIAGLVPLVAVPFFPETPPYLFIQKGDLEGSLKAMRWLWGQEDHKAEMEDLRKEKAAMEKIKIMTILELFRDRTVRCQVYLIIMVALAGPLSGIIAIYFYSFEVLHTAGLDQELIPYVTLGIGACDLGANLVCLYAVQHFGRRQLLLWGYGSMMLLLALLTAGLSLQDHAFWLPYCNMALIFLFVVSFAVGPAGGTLLVTVELFTQSSRPAADARRLFAIIQVTEVRATFSHANTQQLAYRTL
uniref:Uncharacterized protein n=1 Tax=Sphaerodactylus townsendi TaxID=933632 RepID=A0ACB8FMT7_9SAUR